MFKKRFSKKAFEYWQNEAPMHPLTCGNGCGNLKLKAVIKKELILYCPKCDYMQNYNPELINGYYKYQLQSRKIKFQFFFRWYDLWIGAYIDKKSHAVYIIPFPMFGIKLWWKYKKPFDDIFE